MTRNFFKNCKTIRKLRKKKVTIPPDVLRKAKIEMYQMNKIIMDIESQNKNRPPKGQIDIFGKEIK